jgi:hypothetical protein
MAFPRARELLDQERPVGEPNRPRMKQLTLFLALPTLSQELSPAPNSQVTVARPTITATFYRDVGPARIWVDGTEFTAYADHRGRTVRLVPPYNLDYGNHRVRVRTNYGSEAEWDFRIVPNNRPATGSWNNGPVTEVLSYGPVPGSVVTVTRPPVVAIFNGNVRNIRMTVDGVDVTAASRVQSNRITWNPGYDLDQGQHNCVVTATSSNGQAVRGDWNFTIRSW